MDRFHLLTVYVAVAETGGFAAAARQLKLSPPAVTRAVATLETRLGARLLHRTTRHVRVTDAGQRYLADARRILAELEAADAAAAGVNAEPRGELTVTAPVMFGRLFVMPGIVEYLQRHPATTVSALFLDRIVNLLEEDVDVGVRIGELPDSSLRALRVGAVRRVVCAAPAYLHCHGRPVQPGDLACHTLIAAATGAGADWRFGDGGYGTAPRLRPRLTVTSNDAAIEAARAGFGITRLLSYQIAPQLATGELEILLPELEPPPRPIHIVHREGRYPAAKVRAFVDLLAARLRAEPALGGGEPPG